MAAGEADSFLASLEDEVLLCTMEKYNLPNSAHDLLSSEVEIRKALVPYSI